MSDAALDSDEALRAVDVITLIIEGRSVDFDVICGVVFEGKAFFLAARSEHLRMADEETEVETFAFEYLVNGEEEALLLVEDQELVERLLQIMDDEVEAFEAKNSGG